MMIDYSKSNQQGAKSDKRLNEDDDDLDFTKN
jgi:hypothetical protein